MGLAGNGPVNLGSAYGEIVIDVSRVERDINGQIARIEGGLGAAFSRIGGQLQGIGAQMTLALAPVTMFATRGLGAFMNFDAILTEIQARTGLTADEMERVQAVAIEMGQKTAFSATDAAEAMLQLVTSGSSVDEAISALPSVLDLAAAGGLDLGFAADALTDIMAQFGLEVKDITPAVRDLATESGVTRDMLIDWGNNETVTPQLEALSKATGLSVEELYAMRGAITEVSPDMVALAEQTGVTADMFDGWGTDGFNVTPELKALSDATKLSVRDLYDLFVGSELAFSGFEDAVSVTESLTRAAGSSSATVNDLIQGFANVGPIASSFGLSVDDTAAVLAVFAENGIKGAEAGTQLKSMLTNMTRNTTEVQGMWDKLGVSMYDANGNMRDLDDVIDDLNIAMDGMSDQERIEVIQTLAGSYGQMGLTALLAAGGLDEMKAKMDAAAEASVVAQAQLASFRGVMFMLRSTLETLSIVVLGPLAEQYLMPLAVAVTGLVNELVAWLLVNPEIAATLGLIVGGLSVLGPALFMVGTFIQIAASGFMMLAPIITAVGIALGLILSPVGLVVTAIAGLYAAWQFNLFGIRDITADAWVEIQALFEEGQGYIEGLGETIGEALAKITLPEFSLPSISLPEFSLPSLPSLDFSGLKESIENALSGLDLTIDFSGLGNEISNDLISAILAALSILVGGPIGIAIGVSRLVLLAFENDFMGFRTALEESGVITAVEDGLNTVLDTITGFFSGDMTGEGQAPALDFTWFSDAWDSVAGVLTEVGNFLAGIWTTNIQPGLVDLGDGILGFFTAFEDTDTEGFVLLAQRVGDALVLLFGALVVAIGPIIDIGTQLIGDALSSIGAILPVLGEAISDFVSVVSLLLQGDFAGAFSTFTTGLGEFFEGIVNWRIDQANAVLDFLSGLLGLDLGQIGELDLAELSGNFSDAIDDIWDRIYGPANSLKTYLMGLPDNVFNWLIDIYANVQSNLYEPFATMVASVVSRLTGEDDTTLKSILMGLPDNVVAWLGDMAARTLSIGQAIVQGIINGVSGMLGTLQSTIEGAANSAIGWFKGPLGISSPSKVFKGFGGDIVDGLTMGLRDLNGLELAMSAVIGKTMPTPMPAEGLGGRGGAPQTSNAWTINVSVPAEVLRNEPGLGRNADMFGDMLLQRMRGKGGR